MKRRNASEGEETNGSWLGCVNSDLTTRPGPRTRSSKAVGTLTKRNNIIIHQTPTIGGGPKRAKKKATKKKKKKEIKEKRRGVTFEKILRRSNAPSVGSSSNLTVPAWFVKAHGDELRQSVLLRSAATKKEWTVHLGVYFSRNVAQVKFYSGWWDFAACNGLGEGDLLVFCLRQVSQFDVYIYRKARGPDSALALPDGQPSPRTKKRKPGTRPCKERCSSTKKANRSGVTLAELIANGPGVTQSSSDAIPDPPDPRQIPGDLPCFIKRMVISNLRDSAGYATGASLEIPHMFSRTHNMQLRTSVELRGFREGAPVRVVACRITVQKKQTRLFLRNGWSSFVSDNKIRLGQVLVFTLTGYSSFAVTQAPPS